MHQIFLKCQTKQKVAGKIRLLKCAKLLNILFVIPVNPPPVIHRQTQQFHLPPPPMPAIPPVEIFLTINTINIPMNILVPMQSIHQNLR